MNPVARLAYLVFAAVAVVAADPARAAISRLDSLYRAGEFAAVLRATESWAPKGVADTLDALARAGALLMSHDAARATALLKRIEPWARDSRRRHLLLAEALRREGAYSAAAREYDALERTAMARRCDAFARKRPYRVMGDAVVRLPLAQVDPLPVVSLEIPGLGARWFLIDTGAGDVVLDPAIADTLALARSGSEMGTFGGGRQRAVELAVLPGLRLGAVEIADVPVALLDVSRFAAVAGGRKLAGIIGTHLFMQFHTTLDYPGAQLILAPRGTVDTLGAAAARERAQVPFWLGGDHLILVRGRMAAGPEAVWFLDTGLAGAAITAPEAALREAGIPVPDTSQAGLVGQGGGGPIKIQMFQVPSYELGGARGESLLGIFGGFPASLEHGQGYRIAGIVSHAFLRPWRVTFDFEAGRLTLAK